MAGERGVQTGGDAVGNVIATGDSNVIDANVTATRMHNVDKPSTIDVAAELASIRTFLMSLEFQHANKIGRALDDADEASNEQAAGSKDALGEALDRALRYAKSASAFAAMAGKLAPHLQNVVAWLGAKWTSLLTHLA